MRGWIILITVLAALVSLVRHFPLAWVGSFLPDGIGTYSGTIWNGQVSDVPLLGAVSVEGRLVGAKLGTAPGDVTFSGDVTPSSVSDLRLSLPIALLPISDDRLAGLGGRVSLRIDEAAIEKQTCAFARGTASTNVLSSNRARFQWAGPDLSGTVDCVEGRLRVRLSGEDDAQTVDATIVTGLDGVYQADITVTTRDPMAGNVLTLFGFSPNGEAGYSLAEQGRWR